MEEIVGTQLNSDPERLIRQYLKIGIISMLVIVSLTSYGIYRIYLSHIVADAELGAVSLANFLMESEKKSLVVRNAQGVDELRLTPETAPVLTENLKRFSRHFNIIKIKIFDRHMRIIHSDDPSIVGKSDRGNPRLANALAGKNDSKVVEKEKILDFEGKEKFDVDVVETYIPVRDDRGDIIGSFELYQDVTPFNKAIKKLVALSGGVLTLILLWTFLVSFVLLRKEAIQLKAVQEVLKGQATTDFLTGTCNRRQLLTRCEEEMSRLVRVRQDKELDAPIGFIMIDIDHFKKVNDTYGHAAGDEVIRELAQRLRGVIRQHDIIGRYGGEEFLVALPQTAESQLRSVAERLWSCVRSTPFRFEEKEIAVTISLGVAASTAQDDRYEKIVSRADDALYRSKHEGRDRITYA